jgi:hypothetical protein
MTGLLHTAFRPGCLVEFTVHSPCAPCRALLFFDFIQHYVISLSATGRTVSMRLVAHPETHKRILPRMAPNRRSSLPFVQ